jgi:hypothetical protein
MWARDLISIPKPALNMLKYDLKGDEKTTE